MFHRDKFKALVHYICAKCDDPSKLGAVKLNKVLWFSDVIAFAQRGAPITGARYTKQRFGPVPKALLPILGELESEGAIRVRDVEYYGRVKKEYESLREPDTTVFDEGELKIFDLVIGLICEKHTAATISALTHDDIWKLAEIDEEIPLSAMLASHLSAITEDDIRWAMERVRDAAA